MTDDGNVIIDGDPINRSAFNTVVKLCIEKARTIDFEGAAEMDPSEVQEAIIDRITGLIRQPKPKNSGSPHLSVPKETSK